MTRIVEIRSYNLCPGSGAAFHALVREKSLPMLAKWKVDVVAVGPSLHDPDSYILIRAYDSPEHRQRSQDAFYGSAEWREGPRDAILALIENYTTVLLELPNEAIEALRVGFAGTSAR
jgi:hypothetical protein